MSAARGHLVTRAIRHGATWRWIEELDLPSNMGVERAGHPPAQHWCCIGRRLLSFLGTAYFYDVMTAKKSPPAGCDCAAQQQLAGLDTHRMTP